MANVVYRNNSGRPITALGLKPEALLLLEIVKTAADRVGIATVRVTSVTDGVHSRQSRHYLGYALDFGTHEHLGKVADWVAAMNDLNTGEFVFIWEARGTGDEHVHGHFKGSN
jgi:hypothetical protein